MSTATLQSRRTRPEAPNHQLGTLQNYPGLPLAGHDHRAHADTEMAVHLTLYPKRTLMERFERAAVTFDLLKRIQQTAKARLEGCVERYRATA
jgi:DNA polymerase-3 subunit epsilon